ncbi:MAG: methylenetetrahydrofolate reductase, partial [Bdellovibrionota bacterium]
DHHYFGITNVLGLRGDPPTGVADSEAAVRPGAHHFAYQLIEQISALNRGQYLDRSGDAERGRVPALGPGATDFCIGAAAYPEHPDFAEGVRYFDRKVQAGAEYGITQMVFDAEVWARFRDATRVPTVPILPGIRIVKSAAQALRVAERFGVRVPDTWLQSLDQSPTDYLDPFCRFVKRLRELGAPGVHVFVMSDTASAVEAFGRLRA